MPERIFPLSQNYAINESFELLYGPELSRKLVPCTEITDGDLTVSIVSNNHVKPEKFLIDSAGRKPIRVNIPISGETVSLDYPGKSGILTLGDKLNQRLLERYVSELLDGKYDRRDHLHHAKVSDINEAGWKVFWAPLQLKRNLIHVRIVCESNFVAGEITCRTLSLKGDKFLRGFFVGYNALVSAINR